MGVTVSTMDIYVRPPEKPFDRCYFCGRFISRKQQAKTAELAAYPNNDIVGAWCGC